MVKVDIAFDEVENIKKIRELSVVLYPDSFFYGLWSDDDTLVKTDSHSLDNFGKLLQILSKTYKFKIARLMSTVKPFVHLPRAEYQKKYYEDYFDGVYDVQQRKSSKKDVDDFLREEITTLHYLNKKAYKALGASDIPFKSAHISTALASYSFLIEADLICYFDASIMHICYARDGKFMLYNQYFCEQAEDYLYYILMVMDHFKLDPLSAAVQIGGYISNDSAVMKLLSAYIKKLHIVDQNIQLPENNKISKQYYYDLYLCKSCV